MGRGALMRVDAGGGTATALPLEKNSTRHIWPQFLPDGRHLLYFAGSETAADSGIYIQELGAAQLPVSVLKSTRRAAWSPPGHLLFVRESILFAQMMNPKSFQLEGEPIAIADEVTANEGNGRAAFSISKNGVLVYRRGLNSFRQLAWYDREGNRLSAI